MREGWKYKLFEDCLMKAAKPKQVQTSEYNTGTKYPIISQEDKMVSGYCDDSSLLYHIEKPIVIFGDHTRVLKYVDFDFVVGADGVKILITKDFLRAKFLLYYLRWYNVPSLGYSRHYKLLKEINIPVPPLSEQQRIVSELDLLSSIIEKKKAQLKEYDQLAQSIFYDMFGDPVTNEKGWEVKKLGEVCYIGLGFTHTPTYVEKGIPFLSVKDISSGVIDFSEIKFVSEEEYLNAPKGAKPNKGDILFCRVGTMGKPVIINTDMQFCTFVSLGYLRILFNQLNNVYVKYWMLSDSFNNQVTANVRGLAIKNLNTGWLKMFDIPLPPLSLQQSFAEKIEAIEKQKELIKQSITETEALFNSRMDYYFN